MNPVTAARDWDVPLNERHVDVEPEEYPGCPWEPDRPEFVRPAGLATVGALIMVGIPPGLASSAPAGPVSPRRRSGLSPSYPIPDHDDVQIDHNNQLILVRWKHQLYAFNLSCPHQNAALHWNQGDTRFHCPKHHSQYQPDGTFVSGRATRNMDRFTLIRSGNDLVVNINALHRHDTDPAGWDAATLLVGDEE